VIDLLRSRLEKYSVTNAVQEEQALKEILQEVALYALWRSGFFEIAAFQGGTSLRILYGLPRFSEDLDFILLNRLLKYPMRKRNLSLHGFDFFVFHFAS